MNSIYKTLKESALNHPSNIAYDFLGYKRSYSEFLDDVNKKAYDLRISGFRAKEIVTLCLPNIPEALVLFYALNQIGCIVSFIHPNIPISQYEATLKSINSDKLFILNTLTDTIKSLKQVNLFNSMYSVSVSTYLQFNKKIFLRVKELYLENQLLPHSNLASQDEALWKTDDTAVILFSGGTTGTAKAIELTNTNVNSCAIQTAQNKQGSNHNDKMLAILPLFHGYGLISCIHATISESHQLILLPFFEEKLFIKTFKRAKPNYINGIPKLYKKITPLLSQLNFELDFLKGLYCGGSYLDDKIRNALNEVLCNKKSTVTIQEGYGLTEMGGAVTLMPPGENLTSCVGKPFQETVVMVVDEQLNEVATGKEGRLCFKSPAVMKGYMNTTTQPFINFEGKWLVTNDIGYVDNHGYVYYTGRLDRIVKISGYEVHPANVEKVINQMNNVSNSCVIPITQSSLTSLKAFVVARNVQTVDIMTHCNKHLPRWSVPKEIEFVSEIPQSLFQKNNYNQLISKEKIRE